MLDKRGVPWGKRRLEKGRDQGVTLIELLMVCVIIILLVSLLLPGVGQAKEEAQRVACRVAVRSYGVGVGGACPGPRWRNPVR